MGKQENMAVDLRRSSLWLLSIAAWALQIAFGLVPAMHILANRDLAIWSKLSLVVCYFWLAFAWLCSSYYLVVTLFSFRRCDSSQSVPGIEEPTPPVVILYTTCNDFNEVAFLSCLTQEYPTYSTYILDDSDDPRSIAAIDRVQRCFPSRIAIVRRDCHAGFKAGNLNHGLGRLTGDFQFFVVCDADTVLPPNFIQKTLAKAHSCNQIGFVQAAQKESIPP